MATSDDDDDQLSWMGPRLPDETHLDAFDQDTVPGDLSAMGDDSQKARFFLKGWLAQFVFVWGYPISYVIAFSPEIFGMDVSLSSVNLSKC